MIPEWLNPDPKYDYYLVGDPSQSQVVVGIRCVDQLNGSATYDFTIWDAETGEYYNGGMFYGTTSIESTLDAILAFTFVDSTIYEKIA